MREQDCPSIANPVVEVDCPFGRLGREIGSNIVDTQRHAVLLLATSILITCAVPCSASSSHRGHFFPDRHAARTAHSLVVAATAQRSSPRVPRRSSGRAERRLKG